MQYSATENSREIELVRSVVSIAPQIVPLSSNFDSDISHVFSVRAGAF